MQESKDETKIKNKLALCQEGNKQAMSEMVEEFRPYVRAIAAKYVSGNIDIEDVEQHGMVGLIEAIYHFDLVKDTKFIVYAKYWIKKEISENYTVLSGSLSCHRNTTRKRYAFFREKRNLESELGRELSLYEAAKLLNVPYSQALNYYNCTYSLYTFNSPVLSVDEELEVGDLISSPDCVEDIVENAWESENIRPQLYRIIKKARLNDKEIFCFVMKHAFAKNEEYSMNEIGKILGVSRERARQVVERTLTKLHLVIENKKFRFSYPCTIYDLFNFPRESVDEAISKLNEWYREVFFLAYGHDLDNPERSVSWDSKVAFVFYIEVIPTISALIRVKERENLKSCETIYDIFKDYEQDVIDSAVSKLSPMELSIVYKMYGKDLLHPCKSLDCDEGIEARFYTDIVDKLESKVKIIAKLKKDSDHGNAKKMKKRIY